MKLLTVSLARLTTLTAPAELNPRNTVSLPEFIRAMVEQYGFLKFPKTVEEYDLTKGVIFGLGKSKTINVENIVLYHRGAVIETRSSTADCEQILQDLIVWAAELIGVEYAPPAEPRKFFLSEVIFHSNMRLELFVPGAGLIAPRISKIVSAGAHQTLAFETIGFTLLPDLEKTKFPPAAFRIERLAETPFEENKYFSSAPLPTDEHLKLLEDFEGSQ